VLVDIDYKEAQKAKQRLPALRVIVADGEHLPFTDAAFAATVCNSVIEHVANPSALSGEIRRVSRAYFVQTPNGRFPLETHSYIAIPFFCWLPGQPLKRWVCRLFGADYAYVNGVHYLNEANLREFFPGTSLTFERVLGLKKSFYVHTQTSRRPNQWRAEK
jgi:SAM-dependent methyltransferase